MAVAIKANSSLKSIETQVATIIMVAVIMGITTTQITKEAAHVIRVVII